MATVTRQNGHIPAGVGMPRGKLLHPGDVVHIEISGCATLFNHCVADNRPFCCPVDRQLVLDGVPGLAVDDWFMLAGIDGALVRDVTHIEQLGQQLIEVPASERLAGSVATPL
jgi:hypothetical protein